MTLKGYQFDRETVPPLAEARLFDFFNRGNNIVLPGIENGMSVTTSGLTATIDTGMCIIKGRGVQVISPHDVSIPQNASGYLVITIDLTQVNHSTGAVGTDSYIVENNQIRAEYVTELIRQDVNNTGTGIFMLNLGSITSTTTSTSYIRYNPTYSSFSSLLYPVGAIYQAAISTSPAMLFGGTWASIETGRFLRSGTDSSTGGDDTHTHTSPAHNHTVPAHNHRVDDHFHFGPLHSHQGPSHMHTMTSGYVDLFLGMGYPGGGRTNALAHYRFANGPTFNYNRTAVLAMTDANVVTNADIGQSVTDRIALSGSTGSAGAGYTSEAGVNPTSSSAPSTDSKALTTNNTTPPSTGSSSNVPKYQTVYMWRRTA